MATNRSTRLLVLLVLTALVANHQARAAAAILKCAGKSAVCVGPLTYQLCVDDLTTGNVIPCQTSTRCVTDGIEICEPIKIDAEAPTAAVAKMVTITDSPAAVSESALLVDGTGTGNSNATTNTISTEGLGSSTSAGPTTTPAETTTAPAETTNILETTTEISWSEVSLDPESTTSVINENTTNTNAPGQSEPNATEGSTAAPGEVDPNAPAGSTAAPGIPENSNSGSTAAPGTPADPNAPAVSTAAPGIPENPNAGSTAAPGNPSHPNSPAGSTAAPGTPADPNIPAGSTAAPGTPADPNIPDGSTRAPGIPADPNVPAGSTAAPGTPADPNAPAVSTAAPGIPENPNAGSTAAPGNPSHPNSPAGSTAAPGTPAGSTPASGTPADPNATAGSTAAPGTPADPNAPAESWRQRPHHFFLPGQTRPTLRPVQHLPIWPSGPHYAKNPGVDSAEGPRNGFKPIPSHRPLQFWPDWQKWMNGWRTTREPVSITKAPASNQEQEKPQPEKPSNNGPKALESVEQAASVRPSGAGVSSENASVEQSPKGSGERTKDNPKSVEEQSKEQEQKKASSTEKDSSLEEKKEAEKDKSKDSKEEKDSESNKSNDDEKNEEDKQSSKEKKKYLKNIIKKLKNEEDCDEDDVFPDVRDCKKYFRCEVKRSGKHKLVHLRCNKKERFDWLDQTCLPKDEARCLEK
ncbi:sporozoite surface protein 2 isoform X26 [Drosophila subobscura]|uniref:sporozoite surface protein 2 isoform X26 n=1 Tax=Drosophila subobscura TaxID=7241 RepID=UPI00155A6B85|nr:sporozoite surface protein 2 isoform X26 [Drosophila subobscura]